MLCTPMKQKKRFTTLFECLKIQDKNTNPIVSKKYKGIPTLNIDLISYKNTNKIKGSIKVMIKMMISLDLERAVILFPPPPPIYSPIYTDKKYWQIQLNILSYET